MYKIGAKFHVSVKNCYATGCFTLGASKILLTSSVFVTVNSVVHFDVSTEIYHGEFPPTPYPVMLVTHGRAVYRGKRALLPR